MKKRVAKGAMGGRTKPVRQWLSETQYVDWPSMLVASQETGIFANSISIACCGKVQTAGGFRWEKIHRGNPGRFFQNCGISHDVIEARPVPRPVRQWLPDVRYVDWPNIAEAARMTGVDESGISTVCGGKRQVAGGFRWENIPHVDVEQLYEKGNVSIEEIKAQVYQRPGIPVRQWIPGSQCVDWNSMEEASRRTGIPDTAIGNACSGNSMTAGGFCWEKIRQVDPERLFKNCGISLAKIKSRSCHFQVRQWISDTQYVDWPSMSEAARTVGTSLGGISMACSGKQRTAGGFRWEAILEADTNHLCENSRLPLEKMLAGAPRHPVRQWLSPTRYVDWNSATDAGRKTGVSSKNISRVCCAGKGKAGGFRWRAIRKVAAEHLYKNCGVALKEIKVRSARKSRR